MIQNWLEIMPAADQTRAILVVPRDRIAITVSVRITAKETALTFPISPGFLTARAVRMTTATDPELLPLPRKLNPLPLLSTA